MLRARQLQSTLVAHMKNVSQKTVFVGLSGGVDSAVSAALLKQAGYDVVGVFVRIALPGYPCSAGVDKIEAMRVAVHLEIPFREIDLSELYAEEVFGHTIEEYRLGRTPNPDTLCNKEIKFGALYAYARSQGADFLATGHYARIAHTKDGIELLVSRDTQKDQSYFLWQVPEEVLQHVLFPVGNYTKDTVRALAQKFALPNASRKDSQGLCFLGDLSMDDLLSNELSPKEGAVLSESGEVIGTHRGSALYTIGERHGFVIHAQDAHTVPHYIISKNNVENTITVSIHKFPQGVTKTLVHLVDTNWIGSKDAEACSARYRYRQERIPATKIDDTTVLLHAAHYVPEGQSLVLYDGDRCLGGGVVNTYELQ